MSSLSFSSPIPVPCPSLFVQISSTSISLIILIICPAFPFVCAPLHISLDYFDFPRCYTFFSCLDSSCFFFRGLAGEEGRNDGLYFLVVVAFHWKWKQNTISEPRDWERKRNCRQQTRNLAAWFITLDPYTIPPPTWPIDFASLTNRIILRHRLWLAGWVFGFLSFFTGYLTPLLLPLTPIMMNNI